MDDTATQGATDQEAMTGPNRVEVGPDPHPLVKAEMDPPSGDAQGLVGLGPDPTQFPPQPLHPPLPATREDTEAEMIYQHKLLERIQEAYNREKAWLDRLISHHNRLPKPGE